MRATAALLLAGTLWLVASASPAASLITTSTVDSFHSASKYYTHGAGGYFWVALDDGTNVALWSSRDAVSWTSQGAVFSFYPNSSSNHWAVRYLGTTVIAAAYDGSDHYYRKGTLNTDGTVSWNAQTLVGATTAARAPLNINFVNNKPVIWGADLNSPGRFRIGSVLDTPIWADTADAPALAAATSGDYSGGALFPAGGADPDDLVVLRATTAHWSHPGHAAGDGYHRLVAIQYDAGGTGFEPSWYDVSTLGGGLAESQTTELDYNTDTVGQRQFAAVRDSSGSVHAVYVNRQQDAVHYKKAPGLAGAWSRVSADVTQAGASNVAKVALSAAGSNTLFLFYEKGLGSLYSRRFDGTTWGPETFVYSTTDLRQALAPVESALGCSPFLAWTEDAAPPYDVMFSLASTGCASLLTSIGSGTVTVTAPASFELRFNGLTGGAVDQFYDLAEDPGRLYDMAGGVSNTEGLPNAVIRDSGGTWHGTTQNENGAKLDVLEATATRVRVRQEAFFEEEEGAAILAGVKGVGDFSVYPAGKMAWHWTQNATSGVSNYQEADFNLSVFNDTVAPFNAWQPYSESDGTFSNPGTDDFTLLRSDVAGLRTDFLNIMYRDWTQAEGHLQDANIVYHLSNTTQKRHHLEWREQTGATIAASSTEEWNFLVHFKPTDLGSTASPWLDPAVVGRRNDYRGPATPGIMVGTSWQDPDENTASDNFNEAEAAYLFTMDPTNGLRFDLDGAATTRFQPFFKIRQWRSLSPPATITFDADSGGPTSAVTLIRGVDYRSDVKPVSRAPFADDLLWHSTLESEAAVTTPDVGTGGTVPAWSGGPYDGAKATPVAGKYGQGYLFDAGGEQITMVSSGDFDYRYGAVELWFQPLWDHIDNTEHRLWNYRVDVDHQFILRKRPSGSADRLEFQIRNGPTPATDWTNVNISAVNYSWRAGDWVHIRVTWDKDAALGEEARIFVNGEEPGHFGNTPGYVPLAVNWPSGTLRLGVDSNGDNPALGVIDEFRIYSSPVAPGPGASDPSGQAGLAQGGLASDASEYLTESTRNFTYGFNPVDGATTRRGEYAYFGSDSKFRGLNILLDTPGASAGTPDLQWQYWNGAAWVNLVVTDGTSDLTRTGTVSWAGDPFGWSHYSVNGGPDLYYVRAYMTDSSAPYTTAPAESMIKTDVLLFQYCADVATDNEEFIFGAPVPTAVMLMSFEPRPLDSGVGLSWRTASELSNLGFHLYRSLSESGPWTRITLSLIPGLGSSPVGASYSFLDSGLANGVQYFYRLEDVDTASVSTFHGPVSAVPQPAGSGGEEEGGGEGEPAAPPGSESSPGSGSPEPTEPPPGEGEPSPPTRVECPDEGPCLYGDSGEPSLRVVSRTAHEVTVELVTPGFSASPDAVGAAVSVSGFASPTHAGAVDLPFKRAVLDAVVGRNARLVSIEALSELSFSDLRPAALGDPLVDSRDDGTVRAVRQRVPLTAAVQGVPRARLAGSAFMGQAKKLALELYPLRWDPAQNRVVLSQTLRVHIAFAGAAPQETGDGSLGRRVPRTRRTTAAVFAHFHTTSRGLHAVPYEAVFPGPRRPLPLSALRLVQDGQIVPVHVEPDNGLFGPGSVLYFLVDREASSTAYSGELSFALERAGGGAEMARSSASPLTGPVSTAPMGLARFETNRIYQSGLLQAPDIWLWEYAQSGTTKNLSLDLAGVGSASARPVRVRLFVQGGSDASRVGEHHITASWNGVSLGETSFEGMVPHLFEETVPASALLEGTNTLTFTNVGDTGVVSRVFLDRVEVDYPQTSALRAGRFGGEWAEEGTAEVGTGESPPDLGAETPTSHSEGLSLWSRPEESAGPRSSRGGLVTTLSTVSALDVTDPTSPVWLSGLEPGADSVRMQVESGRRYAVVAPEGLLVPRVSLPTQTGLRDTQNQADYVLVAPEAFMDAAQPLLFRRESQGLATFAASLEDIAQEFGGGTPSAEAIRDFLAFAYHSWQQPSPRYVLLLGDASFDPRNFTGLDQGAPLPALWAKTSYLWTASDPAIAAVNGEDLLPDLALGRLPATNLAQAHALVQKVLDWEDAGYDLSGAVTLVADDPDQAGNFEADIEDISQSFLTSRNPQSLLVRVLGSSTRGEILDDLDGGLSLLSYVGHGGAGVWASENVLNAFDPPQLLAQPQQPLMLTMNCLNGYFVQPNLDSLAEAFLKAEGRGTIAAFSPSGLSLDGPAHIFHRALVNEILNGNHPRLGDAVLAAQQAYALSGYMPELLGIYALFGDPATAIHP